MGDIFFGAVLSGITSPFSTLAKSSAAHGRFDSLLKMNFYKCPGYDTKQSDGEASEMLKLWE